MVNPIVKKLLACLLVLCLLPAGALAGGWLDALFAAASSDGTSLRYVSVPEEAFTEPSSRVIGASGDGRNVLIMNNYEIYLWDTLENKRLPLHFSNEEEIAAFDAYLDTAIVNNQVLRLNKEQREARMTEIKKVKETYLKNHLLTHFTSFDHINDCFPHIVPIGASVEYLSPHYAIIAANQLGLAFLADLQTGECNLLGNSRDVALYEDKLLTADGIVLLTTGETTMPAYQEADASGLSHRVNRMELTKDDAVVSLIPSDTTDPADFTREMYLVDLSTERTRIVDLGKYSMTGEPNKLLITGDGRYAAAYNPSPAYSSQAVIIDRESGLVKPIDEALMLVTSSEDGFICYDYANTYMLVLLDPETMKYGTLAVTGLDLGSAFTYTAASSVIGNGNGLYFVQREVLHGYFELVK